MCISIEDTSSGAMASGFRFDLTRTTRQQVFLDKIGSKYYPDLTQAMSLVLDANHGPQNEEA